MKISVCMITLNEEENLPRALRSAAPVADEIVIVDSGSHDKTKSIAQEYRARFVQHPWHGYVEQKNFALQLAQYEWVLSLDADEELSSALQQEILQLKQSTRDPIVNGFEISRVVFFQGKCIRFGDWYPDHLIRLFRKEKGGFHGGSVHERLELKGLYGRLHGELYHYTYRDTQDQMDRIEHYSSLWAQDQWSRGRKTWPWTPRVHALWRLFRAFAIKQGWRGGRLGWQIARASAYEVYLKYSKLSALQQPKKNLPTTSNR